MAEQILLKNIDVTGLASFEVYRKLGGYSSVEKALKEYTPDQVTTQVTKSGLRGRGGAGFPAGMKWGFIDKKTNNPRYFVCNFDESEPGTFKDRHIGQLNPHQLIEGMILGSYALGARTSYIYIRGELFYVLRIIEKAIEEAYKNGFLGENILGSGYSLDLHCQPGAGA
jgi:NADH-quinone oxidoreductase subunit F